MRTFQTFRCLTVAVFVAAAAAHAPAEQEIDVGASAGGQLKAEADFPQPVELPISIFPGIPGYATGEMGIHSTLLDVPTNDFFQLSAAVDLRFILLAKDSGMEVWNDHGSGFMEIGETFFIGSAPFDTHPIWTLVNGTPENAYSLTLKLIDLNGVYSESAPFVLSFKPAPGAGPYELHIVAVDQQQVALSWPTNAVQWELQSTTFLAAANWNVVTNSPDVVGTNFSLSIAMTSAQEFFRLHRQ